MAAPTMNELTAGIHRLSGDMQKSREGAEGIVSSFTELLKTLVPITAGVKLFNSLMGGAGSHISFAAKSLLASTREIQQQRTSETALLATLRSKLVTGEVSLRQYRDARLVHAATRNVYRSQLNLSLEIEKAGRRTLGVATLLLGAAVKTYDTVTRYNEALLEANSSFERRLVLMQSMARVQAATGTAQANLINGTRALVRYGLENKATFEANLKTVVMLHDAVGMSADEAAHLAAVTENYAKASFQEVANVVATIVDQTALAAGEVKNLGVELQRSLGVITPGQTNLPQVIQALSGYESALKEVTGHVGGFQKMISNLATPEGMMQAGKLGVTPEMINTRKGIEQIMGRFEELVTRTVGNSEGLNRIMRLDTVSKMMNLSREEVSEMARAMDLKRGRDMKELSLQELYARQTDSLNQGVLRLAASFSSLLQQGLYPYVRVLSWAINGLASFIQKLAAWKDAGYVAMGVVTVAGIVLWTRLRAVGRAFYEVAVAVQLATDRLRMHAMAQVGASIPGGGTGGLGGAGRGLGWASSLLKPLEGWLTRTFAALGGIGKMLQSFWVFYRAGAVGFWTMAATALKYVGALLVPTSLALTAIAAGLAGIGYLLFRIHQFNKQSADETARVNRALSQRSQTLEQGRREKMYLQMRSGDSEGASRQLGLWLRTAAVRMRNESKSPEEIKAGLEVIAAQGREDLKRAIYTKATVSPDFISGKFDAGKYDKELSTAMSRAATATEKMQKNAEEGIKQDRESVQHMKDADDNNWLRMQRWFNTLPPSAPDPTAGSWGNWPAMKK